MSIDPLDLMDNDFSVIGNNVTGRRNILRRGNLSVSQALQMAKSFTTNEILAHPGDYFYENDVYQLFSFYLLHLSLSQDAKSLDLLAKVYAVQIKESVKGKKEDKLDND